MQRFQRSIAEARDGASGWAAVTLPDDKVDWRLVTALPDRLKTLAARGFDSPRGAWFWVARA